MLGELVPQGGGDPIPLLKPRLLIGRRDSCDITLRFPNVSSHHCELELQNGYWHVRDLGSSNGIKVNGVRVGEKFLAPGDLLSVAKHHFKIEYEADLNTPVPQIEVPAPSRPERPDRSKPIERTPDGKLPTLMELAGLERQRPTPKSAPPASKAPKPQTPEDEAMKWLEDES